MTKQCFKLSLILACIHAAEPIDAQTLPDDITDLINSTNLNRTVAQSRPVFDLTVDDAIERALSRNLDIAVERLNPQIQDLVVAQANSVFLPTLRSSFDFNTSQSPARSQLDGAGNLTEQAVENESGTADIAIDQAVKWKGGSYSIDWNNGRTETNNVFFSFNPSFTSSVGLSYTQPLLRGSSIDNQRRQLLVSQLDRDISDIDLRASITNTLADVRNAYWDLVYASGSVDVQKQALELAEQLVRENRVRAEIGTLASIDIIQAQSEAASRRQTLAEAQQALQTAELALKQLLVNSTDDQMWTAELNPVDRPLVSHSPINLANAVQNALDARTDIERTRRQQEINDVTVKNLRNDTLPSLDLVGSVRLQGQGGTQLISPFLGGPSNVVIPGGYRDAINNLVDADFPAWNVQLQLNYPLGRSAQKAAHARAKLQVQQTQAQLAQIELRIATEVTNAALQVESINKRIEAAQAATEFARQQLDAEETKFDVGQSTNFFVVQAQRDLATALDTELRAILDYQKSLIEFERVQQTSLSGAGITIAGGGGF